MINAQCTMINYTNFMLFSDFAKYLQDLENNASRLKMTEILALLLQKFDPSETAPAIYLMQGSLVPDYE